MTENRNLKAFLFDNVKKIDNIRYVASDRFVDDDGKPMEWEIRPLTTAEDIAIKKRLWDTDEKITLAELNTEIAAKATLFPDLKNTALQQSYNVTGEESLLKALLCVPGEFYDYIDKVNSVLGYNKSQKERIDEAKN